MADRVALLAIGAGVYQQGVPSATLAPYSETACYWVVSDGTALLIDTGDGQGRGLRALVDGWRALGEPTVAGAVVTHHHDDHAGGANGVQARWACPVYLHPRDIARWRSRHRGDTTPWQELAVGLNQFARWGVEVIWAPGHTPGQCNLWIPASGVLLAGDNVLGLTTSVIAPPDGNLADYFTSLRHLQALGARVIGPGHGPVVTRPQEYLAQYLRHRQERLQQILDLVGAAGPLTCQEVADHLYSDLAPAQRRAGLDMVRTQIDWLAQQGWVVEEKGRYRKVGLP